MDDRHLMCGTNLKGKFEELGLRPFIVTAKDALPSKEMSPSPFNAVIMKSINAARRVRNEYGFGHVPIILLALTGPISLHTYLNLGITSFITTPYRLTDLVVSIMPTLENQTTVSFPDST